MKRFSRKWFSQIMIHRLIKHELDQLKELVALETSVAWKLSYGDVIKYLISEYKNSRKVTYPVEPKLLLANSLKKPSLKISVPLTKTSLSVTTKLEGKKVISYFIKN